MGLETPTPPEVEINKPIIDMKPILEKVAPIEGTFAPNEEVQKLWSVPREQRREVVSVFKDKLTRQREAWALCRTNIEERIEANPDLPRDEMVGIVREFASHYGFADSHVQVAESLVDDYIEMHRRVNEVREKYPDNIALINRLTGMEFATSDESDFTVEVGSMFIEIHCSDFNAGRIYEKAKDPIRGWSKFYGFATLSNDKQPIYYIIYNRNYRFSEPEQESVRLPHEREHQKTRIMKPKFFSVDTIRTDAKEILNSGVRGFLKHKVGEKIFGFERKFQDELWERYSSTKEPEEKAFLLREWMRLKRETALNRAKDEIFSRKIEPEDVAKSWNNDSSLFKPEGSYDFLKYVRDWDKGKGDSLWQDTAKRVLVNEYGQIIDNAINAFDQLRNSGHSQSEVIAMCQVPLSLDIFSRTM